jgi:hypothetical protein
VPAPGSRATSWARRRVAAGAEGLEELVEQRVANRLLAAVALEMTFRDVGDLVGVVNQHVVPRLVLRGPTAGHRLVPLVVEAEDRVYVDDHAAVVEALVVDQVTGGEERALHFKPPRRCAG